MRRITTIVLAGLLACAGLASAQPGKKPKPAKKTAICHKTGSSQKPYVLIRVKLKDLKGHQRHAGDIIPAPAGGCPSTAISPNEGGKELKATLAGANEPEGGDPDGTGAASIRLMSGLGQLCYIVSVSNVALPVTGAHIHVGAAGVAGPVVVPLANPIASSASSTTAESRGCVKVSRALVAQILANPGGYYVNVHNADYPAGAVRGQLA